MKYLDWNQEIARSFFNEEQSDTVVWLSANKNLIDKIAEENGRSFEDYIQAVKTGPDWLESSQRRGVCAKAYETFDNWRARSLDYPPYIAYLALFVIAVDYEDEDESFHDNAYYKRLSKLLGEESLGARSYPLFNKMFELWDDLEKWAEEKKGQLGLFACDILGMKLHVGIPSYQVVLREEDKTGIVEMFEESGWDSSSKPSDEQLFRALDKFKEKFSQKTSKRIENMSNNNFRHVFFDRVLKELEEFEEHDENLEIRDSCEDMGEAFRRGSILLCLKDLNVLEERVSPCFRCKRKKGLPDEKFQLKIKGKEFDVEETSSFISKPIEEFEYTHWDKNFDGEIHSFRFRYSGEKYKIFVKKTYEFGIDDWLSIEDSPPLNERFYLAVHRDILDKVKKWASSDFNKIHESLLRGLPKNWHLFKVEEVKDDEAIKEAIPPLAINRTLRIQFEGGIRALKGGNKFFYFSPPRVCVNGESIERVEAVIDNDNILSLEKDKGNVFVLPENTPKNKNIEIKVKDVKKKLTLHESPLDKNIESKIKFILNSKGEFLKKNEESEPVAESSYKRSLIPKFSKFPFDLSEKIYLIGVNKGEIILWPDEAGDYFWKAEWMIQFKSRKKITVSYIKEPPSFLIDCSDIKASKDKERLYKKKFLAFRKRVIVESNSKKKWKEFLKEVEKNVRK